MAVRTSLEICKYILSNFLSVSESVSFTVIYIHFHIRTHIRIVSKIIVVLKLNLRNCHRKIAPALNRVTRLHMKHVCLMHNILVYTQRNH